MPIQLHLLFFCQKCFLEWAAEMLATKKQNRSSLPMSILILWLYLMISNGKTWSCVLSGLQHSLPVQICYVLVEFCKKVSPKTENKVKTLMKAFCWTWHCQTVVVYSFCEGKRIKHNQYVISQMMQKTYYYYIKTTPKAYVNDFVLYKCIQKSFRCRLFFE